MMESPFFHFLGVTGKQNVLLQSVTIRYTPVTPVTNSPFSPNFWKNKTPPMIKVCRMIGQPEKAAEPTVFPYFRLKTARCNRM